MSEKIDPAQLVPRVLTPDELQERQESTALAFRGYNVTNLGRTPELLEHPLFGPMIEKKLEMAAEICAECLGQPVDLIKRIRAREETTLDCYAESLAMIVAVELAQLEILEEIYELRLPEFQLLCGYSLGEITAVIASGIFDFETAMTPVLKLAPDAAELAPDITMGVVFSRGPALNMQVIQKRCLEISSENRGMIAISTYLSPNTVLLLGQHETVNEFKATLKDHFPGKVHLHINPDRWPPIHTPITWQRNISNRAGVMLSEVSGGFQKPSRPLLSCVTGTNSYNELNSREILMNWVDHPQQLWEVIDEILSEGVETILHFGPGPNIIPATFARLSNNVTTQLNQRSLAGLGLRTISKFVRRPHPWLKNLLSANATLLRAPFVEHITVEDWLLAQPPD